jgi:hypothetical protein
MHRGSRTYRRYSSPSGVWFLSPTNLYNHPDLNKDSHFLPPKCQPTSSSSQEEQVTSASGPSYYALKAGYHVQAAVRSESKKDKILSATSIKAPNPGPALSFIIIPELTAEGAYDEAVKGCTYILHIASPLP